jgi:hypothetical protein
MNNVCNINEIIFGISKGKFDITHLWLRLQYTCCNTSRLVHIAVLQGLFDCTMLLNVLGM